MVIATGEYVYTFFKKLDGFLYADVGQLSERHWNVSDDLFASAGFGVRLKVMEGGEEGTKRERSEGKFANEEGNW